MIQRQLLIVEDDPLVGGLLADSLGNRGFHTLHVATAVEAKRALRTIDPDVALIDIDLGVGPSGLELLEYFDHSRPEIALVVLSQRASLADVGTLPDGVAFLRKSKVSDADYLVEVIEQTLRGSGTQLRHGEADGGVAALTKMQREVLRLIAMGYSNTQIGQLRGTTTSGAEQSVGAVFKALELSESDPTAPRVEAARRYIQAEGLPERP